jgi:DNA-binding IclR family transcriptional regulator
MSVLEKATEILDLVAESSEPATLTGLAQRLGQPRSSVHRLLSELVRLGLLLRVGSATYAPGPRLVRWGEVAAGSLDVVRIAKPTMEWLRDRVGESVHLYVRQRDTRVCVAAVEGRFELRHFSEIGRPLPLRVGASGKLLLAYATEALKDVELAQAPDEPISPRAPTAAQLRAQLTEIRKTEWSMSFGEREEGLAAAAVPVRNSLGIVIAALSVSGPSGRLTPSRLVAMRPDLDLAAIRLSHALGWRSSGPEGAGTDGLSTATSTPPPGSPASG